MILYRLGQPLIAALPDVYQLTTPRARILRPGWIEFSFKQQGLYYFWFDFDFGEDVTIRSIKFLDWLGDRP